MKMNVKLTVGADINITVDVEDPRNEAQMNEAVSVAFDRLVDEEDTLLAYLEILDWEFN